MATEPPPGHPEAIVRPDMAERRFTVQRLVPRESLAEFVDYYWLVRWNVADPYRQQIVPQPRVHLVADGGRLLVHGVTHKPFHRTLEGRGHVLGAAFQAGGFRPLLRRAVSGISGSVRPAAHLLGADDRPAGARILGAGEAAEMVEALEEYLVGIGPKWVIQRFRILDAVAAAHSGQVVDWAALARELGFSDQAHLTRAFRQVVGTPPASYRREVGWAGNGPARSSPR
jgi:Helix-turn-helix domain